jgi:hypothetical protein
MWILNRGPDHCPSETLIGRVTGGITTTFMASVELQECSGNGWQMQQDLCKRHKIDRLTSRGTFSLCKL